MLCNVCASCVCVLILLLKHFARTRWAADDAAGSDSDLSDRPSMPVQALSDGDEEAEPSPKKLRVQTTAPREQLTATRAVTFTCRICNAKSSTEDMP